jgi:hypothetical protein
VVKVWRAPKQKFGGLRNESLAGLCKQQTVTAGVKGAGKQVT